MFLVVMAILVNSPPLFYMTVAVFATLAASRLQAWLAVRGLRFERAVPPSVSIGEVVTVETIVWSDRKIRRPLVTVEDVLPESMKIADRTPALPVAPAFDQPIKTRFSFRPMRRGRYHWKNLQVRGTDALGLVTMDKTYVADPVELTVYPVPLPVAIEIRPTTGWGTSDIESGLVRGSGIETRGIREYAYGDPLRHVHWRSSARTGRLMVKEFDTGSGLSLAFVLQRSLGSDVGPTGGSTFEATCGHALFLATKYAEAGAMVWFPGLESPDAALAHPDARTRAVRDILTDVQATSGTPVSQHVSQEHFREGTTVVVFLSVQDPGLPAALLGLGPIRKVCLVYDCNEFEKGAKARSAVEPAYLNQLEATGTEVMLMPNVEAAL